MASIFGAIALTSIIGIFACIAIIRLKKVGQDNSTDSCSIILESQHSKFLNIPIEYLGISFYLFMLFSGILLTLFGEKINSFQLAFSVFIMIGVASAGFLFSLYLTFIQTFSIRGWCLWCAISSVSTAIICALINATLFISDFSITPILLMYKYPIFIVQTVGFVIGIAGATISNMLILRFLRKFDLSARARSILETATCMVWVGLFFIIIGTIGIIAPTYTITFSLISIPSFSLLQIITIIIILINCAVLDLVISPKLLEITGSTSLSIVKARSLRQLAYSFVIISLICWYGALYLDLNQNLPTSLYKVLWIYAIIICSAFLIGQIVERIFCRKPKS